MAPQNSASLTSVLASVIATCPDGDGVREILASHRDPAIKQAFAPFKKQLEYGEDARPLIQRLLELPADAPLHVAVAELLASGVVPGPVHVAVAGPSQPRPAVITLLRSKVSPVVYAAETKGRVSVWSTDTGEHITDLPLTKKGAMAMNLAELADGSLRVRTSDLEVAIRRPGGVGFERELQFKVEGGKNRERYWIGSDDLRYHLVKPDYNAKETPEGPSFLLHLYDTEARKPKELAVRGYADDLVQVGPARVAMPCYRDEENTRVHELALVDLPSGELRVVSLPGEPTHYHLAADGSLLITCARDAESRDSVQYWWDTGTHAPVPAHAFDADGLPAARTDPRAPDRLTYTRNGEICDAAGTVLAWYWPGPTMWHGYGGRTLLMHGPTPGWFILTPGEDGGTVSVIAPYDPARLAAPRPVAPPTEPPVWARPGLVMTYDSADYDAADSYRMRVIEAENGLVLQVDMLGSAEEEERSKPERVGVLRFTPRALEQSEQMVILSQGSTDLEDGESPIEDRLPPCMLGRAMFATLAAGEEVSFTHPWNAEPAPLCGSREAQGRMLEIDGKDTPVPVRVFDGEAGTLTVLDDPSWPLVLAYETGDCSLRITAMKSPPRTTISAAGVVVRRFEMKEGGESKFWEVAVEDREMRVRFGKLGTAGRVTTKTLDSNALATREADKLVREKTKKGYQPAP